MRGAAFSLLALLGCSSDDYVIGRYADGGVGECAGRTGALVCSGFEALGLRDWTETTIEEQGAVERSTAQAHRGRASLHATSELKHSVAVVAASFAPIMSGTVYLRAYLFVPEAVPTRTVNVFFIGDEPSPDPFQGTDLNLENDAIQVYSPQSAVQRQTGTALIPRDRWFCFRARLTIDRDAGSVDAYIDDALALHADALNTLPDEGVRLLRTGVDWSSEQDDFFELYVDDVVLGTSEVGCD